MLEFATNSNLSPALVTTIFDNIDEGVIILNSNTAILGLNKQASDILNSTTKDAIGKPLHHFLNEQNKAEFWKKWAVILEGKSIRGLVHVNFSAGFTRQLRYKGLFSGIASTYMLFVTDISNNYRSRKATLLTRQLFIGLRKSVTVESSLQSIVRNLVRFSGWQKAELWLPDAKRKRLYLAETYSVPAAGLPAFNLTNTLLWFEKHRSLPVVLSGTAKHAAEGDPFTTYWRESPFQSLLAYPLWNHEDGNLTAVIILLDVAKHPLNSDIRAILQSVSGTLANAIQKKMMQVELFNFFKYSADLILVLDLEGYFITFNNAVPNLLGYDANQIAAQALLQFVHQDDKVSTENAFATLRNGQTTQVNYGNRLVAADGSLKTIEWVSVVDFKAGKVFSIGRDRTDLSFTREKLRKIAWSYSHIVRSPLANILGLLHLIEEEQLCNDGKLSQYLDLIEKEARDMDLIIRTAVI